VAHRGTGGREGLCCVALGRLGPQSGVAPPCLQHTLTQQTSSQVDQETSRMVQALNFKATGSSIVVKVPHGHESVEAFKGMQKDVASMRAARMCMTCSTVDGIRDGASCKGA